MNKEEKALRKQEIEQDKAFAIAIKIRDNNQCVICKRMDNLNTHHIIPRENRALRHNPMNAITLCILHHKFSLDISPHKNAFVFMHWLELNRPEQYNYLKEYLYGLGMG